MLTWPTCRRGSRRLMKSGRLRALGMRQVRKVRGTQGSTSRVADLQSIGRVSPPNVSGQHFPKSRQYLKSSP
ncbi:hypothetical protein FOVG_17888 [Fusarium oxysporum f. sp. pisi HDV247]|uniref:Uncharacterized protein n=1 Tax=Fusarium oxysporum f. sp. pisi HDV247 TaxID=1080344 RepID=W9NLB3_FUSOX|nr:hypothetical protein FOVG_17888 [Fusarium oxysporum f. sp. pisi HDV247]